MLQTSNNLLYGSNNKFEQLFFVFVPYPKVLKQYLSSYIWKQALPAYPVIHDIWFLVENDKLTHDVHVEVDYNITGCFHPTTPHKPNTTITPQYNPVISFNYMLDYCF